jgi:hypothetical protein
MDTQIDRPSRFLTWAHKTFGDTALDPRERALRFIEEAIELAHASDIDHVTLQAIVKRVWSRPPGDVPREIGQALATLELLAKATGIDADAEATKEFHRVQSIPQAEWDRRHSAKAALGIAT